MLSLLSFIPVLSWFCLSLIIDRNLINIFTLTYPIQFIWYILKSQLEYSAIKTTGNKIIASTLRFIVSLLPTPFCTGLGQICSSTYQFITTNIMFKKNYVINNNTIEKR